MPYLSDFIAKIWRRDITPNLARVLVHGLNGSTVVALAIDSNGNIKVTPGGTAITTGRKTVSSAGTAEALVASSTACIRVSVCADLGNTNPVVIGDANVVAASDSQQGLVILPGNPPHDIFIDDVSKLYVDAQTNGDSVCFAYYT